MQSYILTFVRDCGLITANMEKTLKENLFFLRDFREPAVGASRCQGTEQSGSRVGLVNANVSNETRWPALRDRTLLEVR